MTSSDRSRSPDAAARRGAARYHPSGVLHQLTYIGDAPPRMIHCSGPAGDVAHWRQELEGTLPRADAQPQRTDKPGASARQSFPFPPSAFTFTLP